MWLASLRVRAFIHPRGSFLPYPDDSIPSFLGEGAEVLFLASAGLVAARYLRCFMESGKTITDQLIETGTTAQGTKRVIMHVLVKRFTVPIS